MAPASLGDDMTIQAGTTIPAVLITGINTEVDNAAVKAQIQSNVFDSLTGQNLLIPAGSQIIGSVAGVNGDVTSGRININWNTLIFPNGMTYALSDGILSAADGAGYSGVAGDVHSHNGSVLAAGVLSSFLAGIAGAAGGTGSDSNYSYAQLASQGAMINFFNTAGQLFKDGMAHNQKTITVDPGTNFDIFVQRSIKF